MSATCIEAEEFVVRGKDGRTRAILGVNADDLVRVELRGHDENDRVAVFVAPNGAAVLSLGSDTEDRGLLLSRTGSGVFLRYATSPRASQESRPGETSDTERSHALSASLRGVWQGFRERVRRTREGRHRPSWRWIRRSG
jgi:hypothetical protein